MPAPDRGTVHRVRLDQRFIQDAFVAAQSQRLAHRGDFFHELRKAFKKELERRLEESGVQTRPDLALGSTSYLKKGDVVTLGALRKPTDWTTDLEYCARYGHGDYSLHALCDPREYAYLPSLRAFRDVDRLCIGNILTCVGNAAISIEVQIDKTFRLVACAQEISARKRKSYVALLGIEIPNAALGTIFKDRLVNCDCPADDLDEITLAPAYQYPALFICRRCGSLYTCACFNGHFDVGDDVVRHLPYGGSDPLLVAAAKGLRTRDGICALCTGRMPRRTYGHSMYFGRFLQSFLPYHTLYSRRRYGRKAVQKQEERDIEDERRARFGYPLVGQGWLTETMLFKIVQRMFAQHEVVHHYRGEEMERLEIDIWIPALKLGIEYQGEQHYEAISHWGGEEGLKKRKANDQRKRVLCQMNGYTLVEFKCGDDLSEEAVARKLSRYARTGNETNPVG